MTRLLFVLGFSFLFFGLSLATAEDPPYRPEAGKFPALEKAHTYRGELVFTDHANRRGSIRVQGSGMFFRNDPHPFAMLPYGMVRYHDAPADLRDIPLGTVMHVARFFRRIRIFPPCRSCRSTTEIKTQTTIAAPESFRPRTTCSYSKTSPVTADAKNWSGSSRK